MANAASTPEFKRILTKLYASGKYRTSADVLSAAWSIYNERSGRVPSQKKCSGCGKLLHEGEPAHYHGNPRKKPIRRTCKSCGALMGKGSVCLSCFQQNPIAIYNPKEMRPRIKVSKKAKRGKIGDRSPLKGYKINAPKKLPMSVIEIRYQRTDGAYKGELFKHVFKQRPTVYGNSDGTLTIAGKSNLWGTNE